MGSKGQHKTHCSKCETERILLKNGRYICPKCAREDSLKHYHTNKKPLTLEQKENKKISNLKWKSIIRDSGFTNQQISTFKHRYKINEEELLNFIEKQNNKCAICNTELTNEFLIDHCHTTNKVRGLLCRDCNFAIGLFKDNIKTLENAIQYLSKTN